MLHARRDFPAQTCAQDQRHRAAGALQAPCFCLSMVILWRDRGVRRACSRVSAFHANALGFEALEGASWSTRQVDYIAPNLTGLDSDGCCLKQISASCGLLPRSQATESKAVFGHRTWIYICAGALSHIGDAYKRWTCAMLLHMCDTMQSP